MAEPFPNPLSLITRYAADGGQADEILICTFNQNLGFFERTALAPCRATGARVTVLGDINASAHDVAAIHRANRRYYSGNVRAARTFHPKLIVIASKTQATVAIGSGNLTIAGWLGNDELWTIHRGDAAASSPVIAQVGSWCRQLPQSVTMSSLASDALRRVADLLERFEATESDVRLVHTLHESILSQLPTGPVDQLNLYAPFHDHAGEASRQLIERLAPTVTRMAFQPGLTSADGERLAHVLPAGVQIVELRSDPYRHGKLIEWRIGDQWTTLTGSPNLSTAALCRTASTDGNVELAVIATTASPLLPDGISSDVASVSRLTPTHQQTGRREVPLLLAATLHGDTVSVEFARPVPTDGQLQVADPGQPPSRWPTQYAVGADVDQLTIPWQPAGSRVRLKLDDSRFSNVTFVADPAEVLTTVNHSSGAKKNKAPTVDDIFTDPNAGRRFLDLLNELPQRLRAPGVKNLHVAEDVDDIERYTVGDWHDYLEQAAESLSPNLIQFALGQPAMGASDNPTTRTRAVREVDWDGDTPDDIAGAIEDENPDDDANPPTEVSGYRIMLKTRQACWRNLLRSPLTTPLSSLITLRLMLTFIAAGGFDRSDDSWIGPVAQTVSRIGSLDAQDDELETELGSLCAVALAAIESTLSPVLTTPAHSRQRAAAKAVSHLLVAADADHVTRYGADLAIRFGTAASSDNVMSFAERIVNADPFAQAVAELERAGFGFTVEGTLVEVEQSRGAHVNTALAVLSRFHDVHTVSVRAGSSDQWAVAAWSRPHLLVLQPGTNDATWGAVYDLTGAGLTTTRSGDISEVSDREVEFFSPRQAAGPLAEAVLRNTGWARDGTRQ